MFLCICVYTSLMAVKYIRMKKRSLFFFPKHFICISFSKASWCQKSLVICMIWGLYCDTQFY